MHHAGPFFFLLPIFRRREAGQVHDSDKKNIRSFGVRKSQDKGRFEGSFPVCNKTEEQNSVIISLPPSSENRSPPLFDQGQKNCARNIIVFYSGKKMKDVRVRLSITCLFPRKLSQFSASVFFVRLLAFFLFALEKNKSFCQGNHQSILETAILLHFKATNFSLFLGKTL